MTALERHLRKWMEKAVVDFGLISPGDSVAVGVSGGKDSLALLHLLRGPFVHATGDFRLVAMHVDAGVPGSDASLLEKHFGELGVESRIIPHRDIFGKANAAGAGKRPCFICARMRRRAMMEEANKLGCNKIALAHHRDDAVETLMMNMFFNREISAMLPDQPLFGGDFHIIRPLYYIREKMVAKFAAEQQLPVLKAKCPMEDISRRRVIKNMLKDMEKVDRHAHENLFRASFRVNMEYMPRYDVKIELPRPR